MSDLPSVCMCTRVHVSPRASVLVQKTCEKHAHTTHTMGMHKAHRTQRATQKTRAHAPLRSCAPPALTHTPSCTALQVVRRPSSGRQDGMLSAQVNSPSLSRTFACTHKLSSCRRPAGGQALQLQPPGQRAAGWCGAGPHVCHHAGRGEHPAPGACLRACVSACAWLHVHVCVFMHARTCMHVHVLRAGRCADNPHARFACTRGECRAPIPARRSTQCRCCAPAAKPP